MIKDKITVVTVVYNAVSILEDTIKSVLNQTYSNIEYIIIDGNSTDGTVDIIKKYQSEITYWLSEPDKGIYDAMNKAIDKAAGKWINFMNAGDLFYSPTALSEIFDNGQDYSSYEAIYGDAEYRLKNISYIKQAYDCDRDHFMPFSHQASFVRMDIAKRNKFNLDYKIAADTEFFLRLNREGAYLKHVSVVVCSYNALEGMSMHNEVKHTKEFIAMHIQYGAGKDSPYFESILKNARMKQRIRKLIPSFIWIRIRESKLKKQNDIIIKKI